MFQILASWEQVASGFVDKSGKGKYSASYLPTPAYKDVNVICSGYCDARSPAPAGLNPALGYSKDAVKKYGTHRPLEI